LFVCRSGVKKVKKKASGDTGAGPCLARTEDLEKIGPTLKNFLERRVGRKGKKGKTDSARSLQDASQRGKKK